MLESAEGVPRLNSGALWVHQVKPCISTKGVSLEVVKSTEVHTSHRPGRTFERNIIRIGQPDGPN